MSTRAQRRAHLQRMTPEKVARFNATLKQVYGPLLEGLAPPGNPFDNLRRATPTCPVCDYNTAAVCCPGCGADIGAEDAK